MSKKQQIMQAAIELFATRGYEKTPISAICEHAQVSKGALFHYFKNKDEVLREVFIHMAGEMDEVDEKLTDLNEGQSAEERLVNLLEQIFLSMEIKENHLAYQFEFQLLSQPSMRAVLEDLIEARYQRMMVPFEAVLCDIPTAEDVVDSHMLIAEIDGIAMNYVFAHFEYPLEQIKQRFINKYLLLLGFEKRL